MWKKQLGFKGTEHTIQFLIIQQIARPQKRKKKKKSEAKREEEIPESSEGRKSIGANHNPDRRSSKYTLP
jgi:hypothetical protein